MGNLTSIEKQTREFADRRQVLESRVQALQDEIEAIKRKYLPGVKEAADNLAVAQAVLHEEIKNSPAVFERPKTQVLHGVRVGFKKEKGKIVIENARATVDRIKRLLPEQTDQLIITEEKPSKTALGQLPAGQLKRLGVTVTNDTDVPFIKPIGDDIDRFVSALLEEGEQILQEAG